MNYKKTDLTGSAKEILQRVINSDQSQLLIPPKYVSLDPFYSDPKGLKKQIGLFSSGTTGRPKCIWNAFENLKQNGKYSAKAFEIEPHHQLLMLAAPWHVAGFSWALMAEIQDCDYHFIITKKGEYKKWLQAIRDLEPDYLLTVPAVLRALYDEEWFVPNIIFGGTPFEHSDFGLLAPHCEYMYQGYGQTEAGGLIAVHKRKSTLVPEPEEHLCNGLPVKGVKLNCNGSSKIPDKIFIRSRTAYTEQEYFSGDLGYVDEAGRIYITGRS